MFCVVKLLYGFNHLLTYGGFGYIAPYSVEAFAFMRMCVKSRFLTGFESKKLLYPRNISYCPRMDLF
jgi:hypothetical protein